MWSETVPCAGRICARPGFNFRSWPPVFSPSVLLFSAFRTPLSGLPYSFFLPSVLLFPAFRAPLAPVLFATVLIPRSPFYGLQGGASPLCHAEKMPRKCKFAPNFPLFISRFYKRRTFFAKKIGKLPSKSVFSDFSAPSFYSLLFILYFYLSAFYSKNGCVRFRQSQKNQPPLHFIADTPKIASESLSRTAD